MRKRLFSLAAILLVLSGLYATTSTETADSEVFGSLNRTISKFAYVTITTEGYTVTEGNKLYLSNNNLGSSASDAKTVFSWVYCGNVYYYKSGSNKAYTLSLSFTFNALQKTTDSSSYINFYYEFQPGSTVFGGTAPGTDTITGYKGTTKQNSTTITGTTSDGSNTTVKYTYKNSSTKDSSIIWNRPGDFRMYIPTANVSGKSGEYSSLVTVTIATE